MKIFDIINLILNSVYTEQCNEDTLTYEVKDSILSTLENVLTDESVDMTKEQLVSLCSTLSGLSKVEILDYLEESEG
jgi:hypothetical protein